jgi:hypothetical protein
MASHAPPFIVYHFPEFKIEGFAEGLHDFNFHLAFMQSSWFSIIIFVGIYCFGGRVDNRFLIFGSSNFRYTQRRGENHAKVLMGGACRIRRIFMREYRDVRDHLRHGKQDLRRVDIHRENNRFFNGVASPRLAGVDPLSGDVIASV